MQYLKRNTKFSILAFLIIILSITISISILAKTEVYFFLSDNPQKVIIKNINQAHAFITIAMRDSLSGGFKDLQDLTQLPEITNLEWEEWKEQGIIFTVK